ncbi:MAG: DUF2336 domain-containing protein [Caulobacteraceae bacterium]
MVERNRIAELIALAHEPSSGRRRELLREITDMFFAETSYGRGEIALFDDVLSKLVVDMEQEVRAELAERMGPAGNAPQGLLRTLAFDAIEVARPILEQSPTLSEADLLAVVGNRGQEHLRAVSRRKHVPEAVCDVIVERGDDMTVGVLVNNDTAQLSRDALERVVDRATENPALHAAVVERQDLPPDLLNEMYFLVERRLRDHIVERNAHLAPGVVQAALEAGRKRIAARDGALPADYPEAEAAVRLLSARKAITPQVLVSFLRDGQRTRFILALAESTNIDFATARRIMERRDLDALAVLCKAAKFDRALFTTFAVVISGKDGMARATEYGKLYAELSEDTAMRTIRFWRVRQGEPQAA